MYTYINFVLLKKNIYITNQQDGDVSKQIFWGPTTGIWEGSVWKWWEPTKEARWQHAVFPPMNLSGKLVGGLNRFWKIFSQWEGSSHILWKIKNVPTTNQYIFVYPILDTHTHTAESNYLLWIGTLKWWGSRRMMHLFIETKRWVGLLGDSHNKVLGHQHHITTYFFN